MLLLLLVLPHFWRLKTSDDNTKDLHTVQSLANVMHSGIDKRVHNEMRYINLCFTYLLTYFLSFFDNLLTNNSEDLSLVWCMQTGGAIDELWDCVLSYPQYTVLCTWFSWECRATVFCIHLQSWRLPRNCYLSVPRVPLWCHWGGNASFFSYIIVTWMFLWFSCV